MQQKSPKFNQNALYVLGRMANLKVLRIKDHGAYLDGGHTDILLPTKYFPHKNLKIGDKVEVFVYHDNDARLIATTIKPYIMRDEIANLECVSVSNAGAFLNWGIHKDLFVPFGEQEVKMEVGFRYFVYLYRDEISGRLVGSAKLNKFIGNMFPKYQPGDEVQAMIYKRNDAGIRAIVDHAFWGILYENESDTYSLRIGSTIKTYVARIREDGKLDLSISPIGYERIGQDAEELLKLIVAQKGCIPIGDKSPSEEVMKLTGLSKKNFKKAVGLLYKNSLVIPSPYEVKIIKNKN